MTAVLVTRPEGEADPLVGALRRAGCDVVAVPTVATQPLAVDASVLSGFDWIVVTSARGAESFREMPVGPRFAAVGEQTAAALRSRGADVAFVPPRSNGASLGETLPDVAGRRVALVRASAADAGLPRELRRRGAIVEEITGYTTVEAPAASGPALRAALQAHVIGAVVFASGSAARGYVSLGGPTTVPAITIGPRTTAVANELGFEVAAEAEATTVDGLVRAVVRTLSKERRDA